MLSFEPFSLDDIGSPQAFQTGETFNNAPIIDYQHPHDLLMQLAGEVTRTTGRAELALTAALVGTPALGPEPFMHRPSASENPQSPLGHHYQDSTHVTPGVITGGVRAAGLGVEGSIFHGREPDEHRTDLDFGRARFLCRAAVLPARRVVGAGVERLARNTGAPLDLRLGEAAPPRSRTRSGSARASWRGRRRPPRTARSTATWRRFCSRACGGWPDAGRCTRAPSWSPRTSSTPASIPIGVGHTHRQSPVGAFTLGATRDLVTRRWGTLGLGGDITGYDVPPNLRDAYGSPLSVHAFVRYRGRAGAAGRGSTPALKDGRAEALPYGLAAALTPAARRPPGRS